MQFLRLHSGWALISVALCCATPVLAQTEKVLASFGQGGYGRYPDGRLLLEASGDLYGTNTLFGRNTRDRFGTVFELTPKGHHWHRNLLYTFNLAAGGFPEGGVIPGESGSLYGTAALGGADGCGAVYELKRQGQIWSESALIVFSGSDGCVPVGELRRVGAGTLYGVTGIGGTQNSGTVFELSRSRGSWTEQVLYDFTGGDDGGNVQGIHIDPAGTIFGTTNRGGAYDYGTAFELVQSGGAWTETTLHSFGSGNDGYGGPTGGLAEDAAGNLYGSETEGGQYASGAIFELSPSNGTWTETTLYSFSGGADGDRPLDGVERAAGALYGVTSSGGIYGGGTVFKLARLNGSWSETVLHSFPASGSQDGSLPAARPIVDGASTIYGTANSGGAYGDGVAYAIFQ